MAAMVTINTEDVHRSSYQRLRGKEKAGKVVLAAVMCKVLFQLNAVARRGTPWVPKSVPIMSS